MSIILQTQQEYCTVDPQLLHLQLPGPITNTHVTLSAIYSITVGSMNSLSQALLRSFTTEAKSPAPIESGHEWNDV